MQAPERGDRQPQTSGGRLVLRGDDVEALLAALATRPFLIVSGLSGTGKTQLVRRLALAVAERGTAWTHGALSDCRRPGGPGRGGDLGGAWLFEQVVDHPGHVSLAGLAAISDARQDSLCERRVAFQPVRPDWNDAKKIWGYYNPLSGRYHPTDTLAVLLNAYRDFLDDPATMRQHFIVLDEMNLARVEYYLSDVLSLMESGCSVDPLRPERVHLGELARVHPLEGCLTSLGFRGVVAPPTAAEARAGDEDASDGTGSSARGGPDAPRAAATSDAQLVPLWELESDRWYYEPLVKAAQWLERPADHRTSHAPRGGSRRRRSPLEQLFPIPPRIAFPPNLVFIGTVNVDETTHGFAPKVLDRGFVIDLSHVDHGAVFGADARYPRLRPLVEAVHAVLEPWDLQVGYRVVAEMLDYLAFPHTRSPRQVEDELLRSKILPRIAGSEERVARPLLELLALTLHGPGHSQPLPDLATVAAVARVEALLPGGTEPCYPESARKLLVMARRMVETGFAAFF